MDGAGAGRSITGGRSHVVELCLPSRNYLDLRTDCVAIALCALESEFQPVVAGRAVVDPDLSGRAEIGLHIVELAIVIEVAERRAAMPRWRLRGEAGFLC